MSSSRESNMKLIQTFRFALRVVFWSWAIAAVMPSATNAATIFHESFAYAANSQLNGQGGWTATANAVVIDPVPDVAANGTDGGNRALQITGNHNDQAVHTFASQSGDVYFSFLIRFDSGTIQSNDFLALWIDGGTSTVDHSTVPNVGIKPEQGGGGPNDYFVRFQVGAESYSTTQLALDNTVQIVARLFKDSSADYNKISLWVNPGLDDFATPDATATFAGTQPVTVSRLGFRSANLDAGDSILIDELRVATAFTDVVLPEPGSVALWLGVAACGMYRVSRRRARLAA